MPDARSRADVCVVGAGAAGIALAVGLARAGKQVILLEGGGASLEPASQEPYSSGNTGLPHRGLHGGRFRAYGGTTNKWGGQILELDALDFEHRPWVPGSGWPFSKEELEPFYRRALAFEGVSGSFSNDGSVWNALGLPEPHLPGLQAYLSRWCPEPNFAKLHHASIDNDSAIQLWLHANVVELLMEEGTATSVRARTQSGREATFYADDFVFCLGAIESSRFFLQPREGQLPWNRSGLLGRHFQDHIDCNAATIRPHSRKQLDRMFDSILFRGFKYQPKVKLTPETQAKEHILNAGATLSYQRDTDEVLGELRSTAKHVLRGRIRDISGADAARLLRNAPALLRQTYRYAVHHRSYQPASARLSLRVHCEQEPCSASTLSLSKERDSLGMFRTKLSWKISSLELKTIREFVKVASCSLAGIAKVVPLPGIENDETLFRECEDSFHHMGGMRMDSTPKRGVVDVDLKLHGTRNTWVCSSAVFPSSGFSNPTHTLLALAFRLCEKLCKHAPPSL